MFDALLARPSLSIAAAEKEQLMLEGVNALTKHHYERCAGYRRITDARWGRRIEAERLADVPYLPVGLFKEIELSSTAAPTLTLLSSGTTGQRPSRIVVDNETAERQARALVASFRPILGERRLPFLVIDARETLREGFSMTARAAGILGMMKFGGRATYALDAELAPDLARIQDFVARFGREPFLIFGFTFLVWSRLYQAFADGALDLSQAILVHSGGWKTLEAQAVSNAAFRAALAQRFGLTRIHNFYGFVEQIGSVFIEAENGLFYAPTFTDVIIRDPLTWAPLPPGQEGIIQTLSLLPTSYPGHSVLTEDRGVIESVDGARRGKGLRILGRVPRAELRGCSDVVAQQAA